MLWRWASVAGRPGLELVGGWAGALWSGWVGVVRMIGRSNCW